MLLIIILVCIIVFLFIKFRHTKIAFKTFFKRGFKKQSDMFGIYCFHGKQGCSKTGNAVTFLFKNYEGYKIYANLKSLKNIDYIYINGLDDLLTLSESITEKGSHIIFFDELFTIIAKTIKLKPEYAKRITKMLSQMRKKGVIFLTTAQEWLEIPIEWRRYVKYSIECDMFNVLGRAYIIKRVYNGYEIKWNKEENEYISPLIETIIEKAQKQIYDSYDTYEQIG